LAATMVDRLNYSVHLRFPFLSAIHFVCFPVAVYICLPLLLCTLLSLSPTYYSLTSLLYSSPLFSHCANLIILPSQAWIRFSVSHFQLTFEFPPDALLRSASQSMSICSCAKAITLNTNYPKASLNGNSCGRKASESILQSTW